MGGGGVSRESFAALSAVAAVDVQKGQRLLTLGVCLSARPSRPCSSSAWRFR